MTPANFEMYLRSATLALLSIGVVSAALYQFTVKGTADATLLVWGASILSFYLGQHVTTNGMRASRNATRLGADLEAETPGKVAPPK